MAEARKPILCLDFDGVLHSYESGWQGADVVADEPVDGAMYFLGRAVIDFNVQIYSSRSCQPAGIAAMQDWLKRNLLEELGDANSIVVFDQLRFPMEKPAAMVTLDDRAIQFLGLWPEMDELLSFKPWNKMATGPQAMNNPLDVAFNRGYEKACRDHDIVPSER